MARVKQSIRKQAINKNGAKYKKKYKISQTVTTKNGKKTTKYSYTKKVYINGKYRYYYT